MTLPHLHRLNYGIPKALTPMAIFMNLKATAICAAVLDPNIKKVLDMYATPINPSASLLLVYFLVVLVFLIGYCVLLISTKKPETSETIVYGVGFRFVFLQWSMGLATVFFTVRWFITALTFTIITLLLLVWIHVTLYMYPQHPSHPLDAAMIHIPLRLLLVVTSLQVFPQLLFLVLGWYRHSEQNDTHEWRAAACIVSFNLVALVEVALREDLVWAAAGCWIMMAQLSERPKPLSVAASNLTFMILYPIVFIVSFSWRRLRFQSKGSQVALPADASDEDLEVAPDAHDNV